MANFDTIAGLKIPVVSSDPSNPLQGEIWYNSTVDKFRGYGLYSVNAAWTSSPASLNSGRRACPGAGTSSEGLAFAGYIGGFPRFNGTESWNGSSWSTEPSLPTPLGQSITHVGVGKTSCAAVGGYYFSGPSAAVGNRHSQWNGSAWSSSTAIPATRYGMGGCGVYNNMMVSGGAHANGGYFPQQNSYTWNGSSWADSPANNWSPGTAAEFTSWGTSSTNWYASPSSSQTAIYVYNGSSWATSPATFPSSLSARTTWGNSSAAAMVQDTFTQTWNGSAWATSPASANSNHREAMRSNATTSSTDGWVFGGGPGNGITAGETFVGPQNSVTTVNLDFS